ncbi:major histocompatibility complex class I-related gene protein-like [Engystomops pustulosus]|uniref:major histocompatibility complex class I-related gene protein-like n=1 Tax=Engystomops pustulosus TaxID=76066 RepID=UPI003AFAB55F
MCSMEKIHAFLLILLSVSRASCDSHSLCYYFIGVSGPGSGLPVVSIVEYVDDKQIDLYVTDVGRTVPVAPWMKENETPEYWERDTRRKKKNDALFRYEMNKMLTRFNFTQGFHYIQAIQCCELRDDGSTTGRELYTFDDKELMFYDPQSVTFIPTMAQAQIITQRWNSPDLRFGELVKNYLENECIEKLKRFVEYGREDLERRVQPKVKVSGRESGDVTKLHCLVYGFHPRAVDVRWMKNGVDDVPTYETTHVLPNPDGTYQIRVSVDVISNEVDTYLCYVDHSSLEEPLLVPWVPKRGSLLVVIISLVVVILLVGAGIAAGVFLCRKNIGGYKAANTANHPLT